MTNSALFVSCVLDTEQIVGGRVGAGDQSPWIRRPGSALEQVLQHVNRVSQVETTIVVRVRCVQAARTPAANEEVLQREDAVGDVDGCVVVRVPTRKASNAVVI